MQAVVTLTNANTSYRIFDLIRGTAGSSNNAHPNQSPSVAYLQVNADATNAAGKIAICPDGSGNNAITAGLELTAGAGVTLGYNSFLNNISLIDKWLVTDTAGSKADLIWENA